MQWLVRAEDARLDAAAMNDPQVKRMMLVMAAGYEGLAAHAVFWSNQVCHTRGAS